VSWHCSQGATFEKANEGALGSGKPYELDADPDDAIRSRPGVSHLTRDSHVDGGAEIKAHCHAATQMQTQFGVLPHREKFNWVGMVELDPHTERGDVDDGALSPQVRWIVLNMAMTHPKGRLTLCPSAILHGLSSQ